MSTSFVVMGEPGDRAAFTDTIRAFALANRIGDRLTIIGYGKHRRRLEKWVSALQIEHAVIFSAPIVPDRPALAAYDVAIFVFRRRERIALVVEALVSGLRVVALDRNAAVAALLPNEEIGSLIPVGDRIALTYGLLTSRHTDRAAVMRHLAPNIMQDDVVRQLPSRRR